MTPLYDAVKGYLRVKARFHMPSHGGRKLSARRLLGVPEGSMELDDPHAGMVRSIGQDKMSYGDVEMSVSEFASGIPFHLDFLSLPD